jgi:hypothetical protein
MLSVECGKKCIQVGGKKLDDKQVKELMGLLYQMAEMEYQLFKQRTNEKCFSLHPSVN